MFGRSKRDSYFTRTAVGQLPRRRKDFIVGYTYIGKYGNNRDFNAVRLIARRQGNRRRTRGQCLQFVVFYRNDFGSAWSYRVVTEQIRVNDHADLAFFRTDYPSLRQVRLVGNFNPTVGNFPFFGNAPLYVCIFSCNVYRFYNYDCGHIRRAKVIKLRTDQIPVVNERIFLAILLPRLKVVICISVRSAYTADSKFVLLCIALVFKP